MPEGTTAGERVDRPVNLLDIYRTLVELTALPENEALDGRSLVPLLRNPKSPWQPTVSTHRRLNHAVRSDDFRYIRYEDGGEELYDHRVDPMEWTNLAEDSNYVLVKNELKSWLPKVNVPEAPLQPLGKQTNEVATPE